MIAAAGSVAVSLAILLAVPGVAAAAHAAKPKRPVIHSLKVTHSKHVLPARGLAVRVTVRVRNARRCTFLRQPKPRERLRAYRTVSCKRGGASVLIPAIPNPYTSQVRLTYAVKAIGAHHRSVYRKVRLTEAGAAQPPPQLPTASLTVSTPSLSWTGGDVTFTYSSTNATSCALTASAPLWSDSNPLPVPCSGSTPVTVPGSLTAAQWSVTFTASGASGQATASTTLTRQAPSFTPSSNWSGWEIDSSSLVTQVSGTFTVPTLDCTKTPDAGESTWVGIGGSYLPDGSSSGDLLQTGIQSDCSGGVQVDNVAWWEKVPPLPEIPFTTMSVSPGDAIQASVYQASDGSWVTRVDDLSRGISGMMIMIYGHAYWGTRLDSDPSTWYQQEGSGSPISYSGGYTAEWIVEAYAECTSTTCSLVPLADYGTVAFGSLSVNNAAPDLTQAGADGIIQNGVTVSLPTPLTASGFTAVYTG